MILKLLSYLIIYGTVVVVPISLDLWTIKVSIILKHILIAPMNQLWPWKALEIDKIYELIFVVGWL